MIFLQFIASTAAMAFVELALFIAFNSIYGSIENLGNIKEKVYLLMIGSNILLMGILHTAIIH